MSWSTRGSSRKPAFAAVLAAGVALLLIARRRGEAWHTLADQN
jgi:hypothetical protein